MAYKLRNAQVSAWLIPSVYAAGAMVTGLSFPRIAHIFLPEFSSTTSVAAAIGVYSAIASGMLALTAIVFSLTFLMVQFSATAYSPRLVLWIARDPVMSHALGVFTATFLYALSALAWIDRGGSGRVPLVGVVLVTILLVVSIFMFIGLIQRVSMLQINRMLIFIGNRGREIIENLYPPIETAANSSLADISQGPCLQTIIHRGKPQIVQSVDIQALTKLASRAECVIEMLAAVGDAVFDSTAILRVWGGNGVLPEKGLRDTTDLGDERTFEQDPKYAVRLLVDIAIKALSPAINDPTTAVQALDQIEDLLIRLGRRRLEIGAFRDGQGNLRLLIAYPSWEDFLRLAFDEILSYGASSVQVLRRMKALVSELISILPEERRAALVEWRERLQSTVERSFRDTQEKLDASVEDRQGLGSSQRRTLKEVDMGSHTTPQTNS
jgi:uncharacterized membrane protein